MSEQADLLAIGPFDPSIADCLDYKTDAYENVPKKTLVVCTVFHMTSNEGSRLLAKALGTKVWDFASHHIAAGDVVWDQLQDALKRGSEEADVWGAMERFKRLIEAGFEFYDRPNG